MLRCLTKSKTKAGYVLPAKRPRRALPKPIPGYKVAALSTWTCEIQYIFFVHVQFVSTYKIIKTLNFASKNKK